MNKQKLNLNKLDFLSMILTFLFIIFNAFLGIYYKSIWNGTISVYYMFLVIIRLIIFLNETKIKNSDEKVKNDNRIKIFYITFIIMILLDISLIVPITLMVINERTYNFGLIPAIALALYVTFKITSTIIMYKRNRNNEIITFRQLKTIELIDAIVSILTLQNTMIIANNGFDNSMYILTCVTSFIALAFILLITIMLLIRIRKVIKRAV